MENGSFIELEVYRIRSQSQWLGLRLHSLVVSLFLPIFSSYEYSMVVFQGINDIGMIKTFFM